jgi:glucose-6-phosphate 1-epimerase
VDIERLQQRFGIDGVVRFERGNGGLSRVVVTGAAAAADVYLHGAHLTHFQAGDGTPLIFTSTRSAYAAGRAIRGGIPIVFPWFGPHPDDPRAPDHGFARTAPWAVESVQAVGDAVILALVLEPSEATRAAWPHAFHLRYRVSVGSQLELSLTVENRSPASFVFQEALHTYLRVGDVEAAAVRGLESTAYIDKAEGMARRRQGREPVRIRGLTDRVYLGTEATCIVDDPLLQRAIRLQKRGSRSTVVWNPGADRARAMADLGPDEWRAMLCVETANAAEDAVELAPGQQHEMGARLDVLMP